MSLSAAAMRLLAEKGLTFDEIVAVAEANECDKPVSKGALRMRRLREKRATDASPSVTKASHSVTPEGDGERHQSVTSRHIASPPRARVGDNHLRVIPLDAAAVVVSSVTPWPEGSAGEWATVLVDLAASHRLSPIKQPGLTLTLGELVRWKTAGASWEFDVIPVVTTLARKQGPPIASWKFFSPAIAQSVADNRKALEIPEARQNERHHTPSAKRAAREDNLERGFRVGLAVAGS